MYTSYNTSIMYIRRYFEMEFDNARIMHIYLCMFIGVTPEVPLYIEMLHNISTKAHVCMFTHI